MVVKKATTAAVVARIPMALKKETKGTYVFATDADDAAITQVYVRKSAFPAGAPNLINLTLSA